LARIVKCSDYLEKKARISLIGPCFIVFGWVGFFVSIIISNDHARSFLAVFIAGVIILAIETRTSKIYSSGIEGERRVIQALDTLDERFLVLNNYRIGRGDVDHIVVGPTGIFAIETKNLMGTVYFNSDGQFVYEKTGRKGTNYSGRSQDPVRQVIRRARSLRGLLVQKAKKSKKRVYIPYIHALVVFAENTSVVGRENAGVPVLRVEEVANYIIEHEDTLYPRTREAIEKLLLEDLESDTKQDS
jgi:hypothetical protein